MTEKVKKAKAPAKPRKTAAKKEIVKKEKVVRLVNPAIPSHAEIAVLAHSYWEQRGFQHGHAEQDWLRAEHDLLKIAS